ncbi:GNAT family N-acetyltransferase [Paraburkholderia youngii]|uniref:GNAT family N-acetyltransferase n=1 Tax=Paraburkholderia youngii TaxID=2782701 RepID=UPI0015900CC8|nr:GNAT family N-acetyltransferase [Paraburkholderia youngii]NUX58645.1 GNAT family N-acetyltransferase [Paraburkholderia youngii]
MTITFATETVDEVRPDIGPLLEKHYEEVAMHKDAISLAPDWARYQQLENQDRLMAFTARDDGRLIGYSVWFMDMHIHYAGALIATNDVIFVDKDYRRGTNAGTDLILYSEKMLKQIGVTKALWHIKFDHDWSAILKRRGYGREDFTMGKIL